MRFSSCFSSVCLLLCISILQSKEILSQSLSDTEVINHSPSTGCLPNSGDIDAQQTRTINPKRLDAVTGGRIECVNKEANGYPCSNIHLESFLPLSQLGDESDFANDIWGWTSPNTGGEYALIGLTSGTTFVNVSDPINPVVLGFLPTSTFSSKWRDIKTFKNYAFIVSEANFHGMQIFDLTQLDYVSSFTVFNETAKYNGTGRAHNLAINEDSGYAYIVGSSYCGRGLHIVDINNPLNATFAGCYSEKGYTHDAQCVIYDGPDEKYIGKEICFASNEDRVDIIDVTNKKNPVWISQCKWFNHRYVHQGWLTEDKKYFLIDDELDERVGLDHFLGFSKTRTHIFDVSSLDNPSMKFFYRSKSGAIDHNLYIKGNFAYQANYRAGLRVLDLTNIGLGGMFMKEVGYFDIYPEDDKREFSSAWSNYPYFDSGIVIVSGIEQGLYVLRPDGISWEESRLWMAIQGFFDYLLSFIFFI